MWIRSAVGFGVGEKTNKTKTKKFFSNTKKT